MRRTDGIAAGNSGQPLHVNTEEISERSRLCFTQLREFSRDVRYGTVMLA
jgi:hypothetical protein